MNLQTATISDEKPIETPSLSQRELLIERVREGKLKPADAEGEAKQRGLRPFARQPDPIEFDPMTQRWWTLPMAIAWIVWRTSDAVREQCDAYRIGCWQWVACRWTRRPEMTLYEGFNLEHRPMANWELLARDEGYPKERTRSILYWPRSPHDAKEELWLALSDGMIQSEAADIETRRRVTIPAGDWKNLEIIPDMAGDVLRKDAHSRAGFTDVEFRSIEVIDAWPARSTLPETLPTLMRPDGPGYMPLSCAAQWIATNGGSVDIGFADTSAWDGAYRQLLDSITSEKVLVTGTHDGRSQRVAAVLFAGIKVHHLFGSEELDGGDSRELYLFSSHMDEEHWRGGFDDSLRTRWKTAWTKLMVHKPDIIKWWPPAPEVERNRGRGRPSDMPIVIAEFQRRCETGEALQTLAAEARALSSWLARKHPEALPVEPGTIENRIRNKHLKYRQIPR